MVGGGLWQRVETVASTGSTNADLAAAARSGAPGGLVLVADHQKCGRGRLDRTWTAPPRAAVGVSVMLRPEGMPAARWPWLPLVAGLAVAEALREAAGADARVKWPNDVLVGGKKICGILAERVDGGGGPAVVVGMGVNTAMTAAQLPVAAATSLAVLGLPSEPGPVVVSILRRFEVWYGRWLSGTDLVAGYTRACDTIGRRVRVIVGEPSAQSAVEGEAVGVDGDGHLLVDTDGCVRAFAAGDVTHVR